MNAVVSFPLLEIHRSSVRVIESDDQLTIATSRAVKNGYFKGLLLVARDGTCQKISDVEILRGVGPFWGFNLFLNRLVKVNLIPQEKVPQLSFDQIKAEVIRVVDKREAYKTRGDFAVFRASLSKATSVAQLIEVLRADVNVLVDSFHQNSS